MRYLSYRGGRAPPEKEKEPGECSGKAYFTRTVTNSRPDKRRVAPLRGVEAQKKEAPPGVGAMFFAVDRGSEQSFSHLTGGERNVFHL